jgi:DNA-binding beta-propeller fold protein YncE
VSSSGVLTTVAGVGTVSTFSTAANGDGGPALSATLQYPSGLWVSSVSGNIFVGDSNNHKVRIIDVNSGLIGTVAGTGTGADTGDGGMATSADMNKPLAV